MLDVANSALGYLAWTESAIFGFDHFLPISKAYLLEISICTASWWVVASRANSCGARDLCGQAFTQNIHPIWSEASACGKHPSVHVGPWSYGCRVDSSVYQSFHARFCKFSLRSALNCRISESTIYIYAVTAVCMSSTESAPFALGKFLPISKAYLLEILICTAGWR